MTLTAGTRLGPYEILAPLGAGGMGEVYKARDTRLERTVAVKVLPSHMSVSVEVRQRFEREAKAISQLSHPHICALYDVNREGETEYLVMELLEGETLSDRLAKGALSLEQTLGYGGEVADALDKAHRQRIVHRDLKPGNVMITKSGVKLLDFGLAKAMAPAAPQSSLTALPTQQGLTQEGTILGTFQYMAPEQLEGKEADARTDIFAFGAVLYEMATGKKAFSGASQASLISAIMTADPPAISALAPMTPRAFDRVVKKCLAKDPEKRWQSAADLGSELRWIADAGSLAGNDTPSSSRRRRWGPWTSWAVALVASALVIGVLLARRMPPTRPVLRSAITLAPKTFLDPRAGALALSPDGAKMVLVAGSSVGSAQLWIRPMDSLDSTALPGTEGATYPFWSPDSRFIGFFADHHLKRVSARGGSVLTICEAPDGRGASWGSDDVIVLAPTPFGGLFRVSASGGTPTALTQIARQGMTHRLPYFLPDGKSLLFFSSDVNGSHRGDTICALDIESKRITVVARESGAGRYAEPGYLIFPREGNLMAQPFDTSRLTTIGEAVPIAEGVRIYSLRHEASFTVSTNGLLVFQPGATAVKRQLTWFDLGGKSLGTVAEPAAFQSLSISPDGERAAGDVGSLVLRELDVWVYDLTRGVGTPLGAGSGSTYNPIWSPDGRSLAYAISADGSLAVRGADGSSKPRILVSAGQLQAAADTLFPTSWSPDGNFIAFRFQDLKTGGIQLWTVRADGSGKAVPFLATPPGLNRTAGTFSPDGRWLSFVGDETGKFELYVVPFPGPGGRQQISSGGATAAFWIGDGRQIAYKEPAGNKLWSVDFVVKNGVLQVGAPRPLFGDRPLPEGPVAITRDGKRLLIAVPLNGGDGMAQLTMIANWPAELSRPGSK